MGYFRESIFCSVLALPVGQFVVLIFNLILCVHMNDPLADPEKLKGDSISIKWVWGMILINKWVWLINFN